jgi:hypothetical protein
MSLPRGSPSLCCLAVAVVPPAFAHAESCALGWLSVSDPKEMEYHRDIICPAFSDEAADTTVFDLLPMALPLLFNHGLPVGYAMSGNITGETMIKAWNVLAGPGENYHQWIDTPFFHRWAAVMTDGGKRFTLCWGKTGTYDTEPRASQGHWPLRPAALSCYWKLCKEGSKEIKAKSGTTLPPKPWPVSPRTFTTIDTSCQCRICLH